MDFVPPLPKNKLDAVKALGFGLLNKVNGDIGRGLAAGGEGRMDNVRFDMRGAVASCIVQRIVAGTI